MNNIKDVNSMESAIRNAANYEQKALNIIQKNNLVPKGFSRMVMTYGSIAGNPEITRVQYYGEGDSAVFKIECVASVIGINNKYFFIRGGNSGQLYHVWYNFKGTGVDPAPLGAGSIGIEVAVAFDGEITQQTAKSINAVYADFNAIAGNDEVIVTCLRTGSTTTPYEGNVGNRGYFILNYGKSKNIVADLTLSYDGSGNLTQVDNAMA